MPASGNVDRKLAEEFAKELVAELKKEKRLELNSVRWGMLESLLILKIQCMTLPDALDGDELTKVTHSCLNKVLGIEQGEELDEQLIELLDKDLVELVVTQKGKLGYRWKS